MQPLFKKCVSKALRSFSGEIAELFFPKTYKEVRRVGFHPAECLVTKVMKESHVEEPLMAELSGTIPEAKPLLFGMEFCAIELALTWWLTPQGQGRAGGKNRKTPSERYSSFIGAIDPASMFSYHINELLELHPLHLHIYLYNAVRRRQLQLSYEIDAISINRSTRRSSDNYRQIREERVFAETYCSKRGLLPLVWAEILHAVKHDIFARQCRDCLEWFPVTKGHYNQEYCSGKCKREAYEKAPHYKETKRLEMQKVRAIQKGNLQKANQLTEMIEKLRKQGGLT